jgi:hypothetical protein
MTPQTPTRTPEEFFSYWKGELQAAEDDPEAKKYTQRGRKINKRYRSEGAAVNTSEEDSVEFNLFWSNVETLLPATYSRRPRVEVSRRFRDDDPVGRVAGQILERALQYEVDQGLALHGALKSAVKDRLLSGMGQVWVRYEPSFAKEVTQVPDPANPLATVPQEAEVLADERTPTDYVFWEDFRVSPARTWNDVRWVSRRLLFSSEALKLRFAASYAKLGGKIDEVPLNHNPATVEEEGSRDKEAGQATRAQVYEIWSKEHKQLFWICLDGCSVPLDIQGDVAQLEEFFPCPEPLLATTTNERFYPVADYILYQKQLIELDVISRRIRSLTRALRLVGVYDASQDSLKNLLGGTADNMMVPVSAWAAFAEKGGLKGVVDFLPIEVVAKILTALYEAREKIKQLIYEITGMSDIIRGASLASETLGAQQIKAKFASLRLSSRQNQVAEFVTKVLQIKAEFLCDRYTPETIIRISSAQLLPEVKAHPEILQAAIALLKEERARRYRIEVASGSMVELDEEDERKRRTEFMETVSNFMNAAKNVSSFHPAMMPVSLEMLKFAVRGFSVGRSLEAAIEEAQMTIEEQQKNPQPPQPDPNEVLKKEIEQMRQTGENDRTKYTVDAQKEIARMKESAANDREVASQRHEALTTQMSQLHETSESRRKEDQEERRLGQERQDAAFQAIQDRVASQEQSRVEQLKPMIDNTQQLLDKMEKLIEASSRLKRRVPTYTPEGDIAEVREEYVQ